MTTEWNNRKDRFAFNSVNAKDSFEKHNESMREFRRSHANVAMLNGLRLGKAALFENLPPLQVRRIMLETGGSRLLNGTTDWSALVPVLKVAGYKLSQN